MDAQLSYFSSINDYLLNQVYREHRTQYEKFLPHELFTYLNNKEILQRYFKIADLKIDDDVFAAIKPSDSFELWTTNFRFLMASREFYETCSHSTETLMTKDWSTLFTREQRYTDQLISSFIRVTQGEVVFKPCESHVVREISMTPVSIEITPKIMGPVYDKFNNIVAIYCILNFTQLRH